jgi:hypothetical protein
VDLKDLNREVTSDEDWLKRISDICLYENPVKAFEDGELVIPEDLLTLNARVGRRLSQALDRVEKHADFKVAAPLMRAAYRKPGTFGV